MPESAPKAPQRPKLFEPPSPDAQIHAETTPHLLCCRRRGCCWPVAPRCSCGGKKGPAGAETLGSGGEGKGRARQPSMVPAPASLTLLGAPVAASAPDWAGRAPARRVTAGIGACGQLIRLCPAPWINAYGCYSAVPSVVAHGRRSGTDFGLLRGDMGSGESVMHSCAHLDAEFGRHPTPGSRRQHST